MTVHDVFAATAAGFADRPFLAVEPHTARAYGIDAGEVSYGAAAATVDALIALYRGAGYWHGVRVGLALQNRPDHFLHFLALNALGVSVVPLDIGQPAAELGYLIGHSDLVLVVTLPSARDHMVDAVGAAGRAVPVATWERSAFAVPAAPDRPSVAGPEGAREAALMYTSGTTGSPKGCRLSNDYFVEFGRQYAAFGGLCALEPGGERLITPLPVNHMNAMVVSFSAMLTIGGCLVQLDRFHPSTWWSSVTLSRATVIHYLGVMPAMLLSQPADPSENYRGRVKFGYGAGVDPRHHANFEARFGFPLIEAWAMTESGPGACISATHEPRHVGSRCFGKPPEGVDVRLIDEEGADAADSDAGELLVRRAGSDPRRFFFSSYYKDEAATEAAWAGGWLHTGDVVRRGADGSLHFVDRRKNIIRRSGENIAAVEVESVLLRHPAIRACAVAPVPDDIRGEEVAACVVADPDMDADAGLAIALAQHCLGQLAYYKAPGFVVFVKSLPMTASQKIQRGRLKTILAEAVGAGGAHDVRALKKRQKAV
jgi:acyl-CoA synthetase (AMP-forming)/AMP-acid ligase II